MERASGRRVGGLLLAACALVVPACSGSSEDAAATTPAPATTTVPPTTTTTAPTTTSTTTSSVVPTTRRTTTTTTTTTTTVAPPAGDEPARSRPASPLPAPTGFARFEPGPEWAGVAALTGLPAGPEVTARAALAVKIDNAPGGRPQWNLADADIVFEENVEGITRFVAVFHTDVPDRIGPVRSARTSDLDILAGLNRPVLAWSGGNAGVTTKVRGAHQYGWLANLSAQITDCFWRSERRGAPHNLLLDPVCARASATYAGPARPVFDHDPSLTPLTRSEDRFSVRMDGGLEVGWAWDAATGTYLRSQGGRPHVDVDGERISATNVVVAAVDYVQSEVDGRSPEAITVGSGRAVVHRAGEVIAASWSRPDRFSPWTLTADDGSVIALAPGVTFVELSR